MCTSVGKSMPSVTLISDGSTLTKIGGGKSCVSRYLGAQASGVEAIFESLKFLHFLKRIAVERGLCHEIVLWGSRTGRWMGTDGDGVAEMGEDDLRVL